MDFQLTGKAALVTGASRRSAWPSCAPPPRTSPTSPANRPRPGRLDALRCLKRQLARRI